MNEQYSRRNCLRIDGIAVVQNEDNNSLKQTVISKLGERGILITDRDVDRVHRSGKPTPMHKFKTYLNKVNHTNAEVDTTDVTETAQVIIKFTNWAACSSVLQTPL